MGGAVKIPTEQILEHAEIAATYFRALISNGIDVDSAVTLTGNYITMMIIRDTRDQPPREPWEGE